jgi:hypothetical protein
MTARRQLAATGGREMMIARNKNTLGLYAHGRVDEPTTHESSKSVRQRSVALMFADYGLIASASEARGLRVDLLT